MCYDHLWLSGHAFRTSNSAPTKAFDEADDASCTPTHSGPVHGPKGLYTFQDCPDLR